MPPRSSDATYVESAASTMTLVARGPAPLSTPGESSTARRGQQALIRMEEALVIAGDEARGSRMATRLGVSGLVTHEQRDPYADWYLDTPGQEQVTKVGQSTGNG